MDSQQQHQLLPAKHVGSFLFLMFIATFRPTAIWPNFPISLEPIAVLVIALLLFYKIYATIGFKTFWQKYKIELLLLTAYFSVCFLSLYLNRHRYADIHEIIRYGITFIVITMSFPAAIFLFLLPEQKNKHIKFTIDSNIVLYLFITFILALALIQRFDPLFSESINHFFISGGYSGAKRIYNILSIFPNSTDFSAILAIITIFLILRISRTRKNYFLYILTFITLLTAIINSKRIFLLIIALCVLLYIFHKLWNRDMKLTTFIFLLATVVMFHLAILFFMNIYFFNKLSLVFPYLQDLKHGEIPGISSFIPQLDSTTIGDRIYIWEKALLNIKNNFLFGVTNGGLRFQLNYLEQNSHNVFLQILIDSGIIGFFIVLCLLLNFFYKTNKNNSAVIVFYLPAFIIISLLVDFFLDHSLPWVIMMSYFCVSTHCEFEPK